MRETDKQGKPGEFLCVFFHLFTLCLGTDTTWVSFHKRDPYPLGIILRFF